jgi:hypothetical protein
LFNASLKIDFQGSRVTSDGGLILVRELHERLGFGDLIAEHLTDSRRGKNTQRPLADLLPRPRPPMLHSGWCWAWTAPRFRCTGSRSKALTTATSSPPAITRCCCSNGEGDCLAAKLRPGHVHSAEDGEELLLPEIEGQQTHSNEVVFRADAALATPEIYEALEERGVKCAIRIPANDSLERDIAALLTRPVGHPSHKPVGWYKSFLYQAASWKTARRVAAKVQFHCGELFPRVGFIVTNLETGSGEVVRFYNKRGTAEQWIREGKQVVKMTRLSCHRFRCNEVRLWPSRGLFWAMVRRIAVLPLATGRRRR